MYSKGFSEINAPGRQPFFPDRTALGSLLAIVAQETSLTEEPHGKRSPASVFDKEAALDAIAHQLRLENSKKYPLKSSSPSRNNQK